MKKVLMIACAFAALAAGPVFADTIENSYGNTIVVTLSTGAVVRYHFNADGTFALTGADGATTGGAYTISGEQLCMTPTGAAQPACVAVTTGKTVGDSWTQAGTDGSQIGVTIEAGR